MILKGRSRGHGSQLARYLFAEKNEAVRVVELRGTCESSLTQTGLIHALKEFDEYGKLTQGEKTIFHLAIAPSEFDRMDSAKWQYAVSRAEEALGLTGQPRAVVMHSYEGKDHLHVAWSRVDLETHTLKSDSFTNLKLCNVARDIEMELGLMKLPDVHRGHAKARAVNEELKQLQNPDTKERARLDEKREVKRERQRTREVRQFTEREAEKSARQLKAAIATAWYRSDTGAEFRKRLAESGYRLVRGDRGAMVMDESGRVFSPARYIEEAKVKDINAKCADVLAELPSVDQARHHGKDLMLSPRKASQLVKMRLRFEMANDPMRPSQEVEFEY